MADAFAARVKGLQLRQYLPFGAGRQAEAANGAQKALSAAKKAKPQHADLTRLYCPGRLLYIKRLREPQGAGLHPPVP